MARLDTYLQIARLIQQETDMVPLKMIAFSKRHLGYGLV